ncbi:hypothetical protein ACQY1Q_17330 [Tenacibaculum sp. TC6]|uniref:hypothetical protein n=1 Tax=Tenacibaculum sp. TC6 TaxID=3423223 RepID=UPI003D35AE1A
MKISNIKTEHEIITADFKSEENFIFINKNHEIYRNEDQIKLKNNYIIADPRISILSDSLFLLVDLEFKNKESKNAWIIDNKGNVKKTFFADSPLNIVSTGKRIIMSYSDSRLEIGSRFGDAQIVIFDFDGNCLFEYNSLEKSNDYIQFLENKSLVVKNETTIYFMPFIGNGTKEFPIIELNVLNYSINFLFYALNEDKSDKYYFSAFSKKDKDWYFFENFDKLSEVNKTSWSRIFRLNSNKILELFFSSSEMSAIPKGLPDGKFSALTVKSDFNYFET